MSESFARVEDKYPLSLKQAEEFLQAVSSHIHEDTYAQYPVHSLYFDTVNSDYIIHSLTHPVYKMKLRLRSYGDPEEGDLVYLETKKKYGKTVYKRRIALEQEEAWQYLQKGKRHHVKNNTADEIDYILQQDHPVPKVLICYERTCYAADAEADVRITFDQNIRWRIRDLSLYEDGSETALLEKDACIMEIKAMNRYPLWLVQVLSRQKLYKQSFSKYGTIYQNAFEAMRPRFSVSLESGAEPSVVSLRKESPVCPIPF
jgi:SPX domain protein involved in polyphosphate accumulation